MSLSRRGEPSDGAAIEAHTALEGVFELGEVDREGFQQPRMSVNHSRMKRMSRSATMAFTSSGVCGQSADMAGD